MPANLENSTWPQDWKRSVFISIPKKGNAKECSNEVLAPETPAKSLSAVLIEGLIKLTEK